jgi:hypothetical protein
MPPGPTDQERIVWRLVAEAQAQRALIVGNSDMHDVKALGFLGLDGAVVAGPPRSWPLCWASICSS